MPVFGEMNNSAMTCVQCRKSKRFKKFSEKLRSESAEKQSSPWRDIARASRYDCAGTEAFVSMDVMEHDDNFLLSAIAERRDRDAFETLCARHSRRAYAVAFHFLRNAALAEDAVQEAMLAIWLSSDSFRPEHGKPEPWLMSIVVKKSLHLARARKHSIRKEKNEGCESMNRQAEDSAKQVENAEVAALLKQELERLPETDSRLLTCCYGAGMTHRKIAEMLGISQSSVTEKIQQALSRLRVRLSQAGVAAAAPLMEQHLFDALNTASNCPPGIVAGILGRVDGVAGEVATQSQRAKAASNAAGYSVKGPMLGIFAAGCITLTAAAGWQYWNPSAQATPASQSSQRADALFASWDFNESAADFPVFGEWKWAPKSATQTGAMVVASPGVVGRLPLKVPQRPFAAVFTVRFGAGPCSVDSLWCDDDQFPEFDFWRSPGPRAKVGRITFRVVFKDCYVTQFADGTPVGIRKYGRSYPFDQICIQLKNVSIERLVVRDLLPEDESAEVRDPEALIARFAAQPASTSGKSAPLPFVSRQ
jgi:RNA polymerase sigma-70 factor, ECF subfamily